MLDVESFGVFRKDLCGSSEVGGKFRSLANEGDFVEQAFIFLSRLVNSFSILFDDREESRGRRVSGAGLRGRADGQEAGREHCDEKRDIVNPCRLQVR